VVTISHTYDSAGSYVVILKATDKAGQTAFLQLVGQANGAVTQSSTKNAVPAGQLSPPPRSCGAGGRLYPVDFLVVLAGTALRIVGAASALRTTGRVNRERLAGSSLRVGSSVVQPEWPVAVPRVTHNLGRRAGQPLQSDPRATQPFDFRARDGQQLQILLK